MNKQVFFSTIKKTLFGGKLTQSQVSGMDSILDSFESNGVTDNRYRAYMLATVYHECAKKMQPIEEYGGKAYFTKRYGIEGNNKKLATELGNINVGDGYKYAGRGYVQCTGRANYKKMGDIIGVNLVDNPELALNPTIATQIMIIGMTRGIFTGKKLSDYFTAGTTDWKNARRIINGMDKADLIAGYALKFYDALKDANDN